MRIVLNGEAREVSSATLQPVLEELGYGGAAVATAVNGDFVPASQHAETTLRQGDRLEVLAPMQGG